MELARPFVRLPVFFDVDQVRAKICPLPTNAWLSTQSEAPGSAVIRLISVEHDAHDDCVHGIARLTDQLNQFPHLKQILASFGVAWSDSFLLKLCAGARISERADLHHHWLHHVRIHVPIVTGPGVLFHCEGQTVRMASGEAWVLDNWRPYNIENETTEDCIHLVGQTSGDRAFWELVKQSDSADTPIRECILNSQEWRVDPLVEGALLRESIIQPAELDQLVRSLYATVIPKTGSREQRARLERFRASLVGLCHDWRHTYAVYGDTPHGWLHFSELIDRLRIEWRADGERLIVSTNGICVLDILENNLPRAALACHPKSIRQLQSRAPKTGRDPPLSRPIFIVCAPRSGSTLLFETLAANVNVCTVGSDALGLGLGLLRLQPGAPNVDSHRLDIEHCTDAVATWTVETILANICDSRGGSVAIHNKMRFLEKTPRNSLRIPFFNKIFPDALFVLLWRDPRENISSLIEIVRRAVDTWCAQKGTTWEDFGVDWPSFMLRPPGWQFVREKTIEEIAAYQWDLTNRIALQDLAALPDKRWTIVNYADLTTEPKKTVTRLCRFLELEMDCALADRLSAPLPLSRSTITHPQRDKWRLNEAAISRVLPSVEATWRDLDEVARIRRDAL